MSFIIEPSTDGGASGTTVGEAFLNLTNPSAVTFPRINADNTVDALSAANFLTAIGAAGLGANSFTGAQTIAGGTVTVSTPLIAVTQTWNDAGVQFIGITEDITATAAANTSRLIDLKVGGTSKFFVRANSATYGTQIGFSGNGATSTITQVGAEVTFNNGYAASLCVVLGNSASQVFDRGGSGIKIGSNTTAGTAIMHSADSTPVFAWLYPRANDVLSLRNGTTGQTLEVYGTGDAYGTDTNYVRVSLSCLATSAALQVQSAGTGATDVDLTLIPAGAGYIQFGNHSGLVAETVTGYMTVKDGGGTLRKLAVIS